MALEFIESFDSLDMTVNGQTSQGGEWVVNTGSLPTQETTTRWGGSTNRSMGLGQDNCWAEVTLTSVQTRVVGLAFRASSMTDAMPFLKFYDGTTLHVEIRVNTSGQIEAYRGGTTLLGTSSSTALVINTWYYIETKVKIDDSTGTVEVRVNGSTVYLNLTSQDTRNAGNATTDKFRLSSIVANTSGKRTYIDDLYVLNTSGASRNDFLGDMRVEGLFPSANGANTDFTTSTGVNHAALVDEQTPNGDSDYVESSTLNHQDTFTFGDLSVTSGTVYGIKIKMYAKRTDVNPRSIARIIRQSGSNNIGSDRALTSNYASYMETLEQNPHTTADFTISEINAHEYGVKVTV